jgi:hypothetical protein
MCVSLFDLGQNSFIHIGFSTINLLFYWIHIRSLYDTEHRIPSDFMFTSFLSRSLICPECFNKEKHSY